MSNGLHLCNTQFKVNDPDVPTDIYGIELKRVDGKFTIRGKLRFRKAINCLITKNGLGLASETSLCRPTGPSEGGKMVDGDVFDTKVGQMKALQKAITVAIRDSKMRGEMAPILITSLRTYYTSKRNAKKKARREAKKLEKANQG